VLHRVATVATIAVGLCALAGCAASSAAAPSQSGQPVSASASATPGSATPGSATPGSATPGSATPGSATPGSATPGSATPGSAARHVAVDERDNHKVIRIARGTVVTVVLHSTYWRFGPAPGPRVLAQLSAPRVSPRPVRAGGCVPGQGCGTVTVGYRAIGAGTALVRASRVSCGEALRCTGGNGLFSVTLIVRR